MTDLDRFKAFTDNTFKNPVNRSEGDDKAEFSFLTFEGCGTLYKSIFTFIDGDYQGVRVEKHTWR